jgi:ATPase subunit of ABC transporter with duplicated ATPase domains
VSSTLVAKGLGAGHGDRLLFSDLDLVIGPGDVTGLVGANGAGKSTLLRILAGINPPDEGSLTLVPSSATVGYLPQEQERRPGHSIATRRAGESGAGRLHVPESINQFLGRRTGVSDAEAAMNSAAIALGEDAAGAGDEYSAALERWLDLGGADLEERTAETLADVA